MRTKKVKKIDLNTSYPCPCCKKGSISAIALTEAFGCDRCQQIFVIEANERIIKQLANSYAIEGSWQWTGKQWKSTNQTNWKQTYLSVAICTIFIPAMVFLILGTNIPTNAAKILLLALFLAAFSIVVWLAYRN
ncbi:MAG: hypothetical protein ACFBSE_07005 [Prochloraceae cyanobacterium]